MHWTVLENNTTHNSFFLMLGQTFHNSITLIILFFVTRRYSPGQVGVYTFAFSLVGLLTVTVNLGSSGLLVRGIAMDKPKTGMVL